MNVIFLTTGSANSTVCMKMLQSLGWNLGNADDKYAEHIGIRRLNIRSMKSGTFETEAAKRTLAKLPEPWAVKDPRFCHTLQHWQPLLEPYRPLLLWVTKRLDYVQESMTRRFNTPDGRAVERDRLAQGHFLQWPWTKWKCDVDRIAEAVQLFDPARLYTRG